MRYLILGAIFGVLVVYPVLGAAVLGLVATIAAAALGKPLFVAFAAGLVVGPRLARIFTGSSKKGLA